MASSPLLLLLWLLLVATVLALLLRKRLTSTLSSRVQVLLSCRLLRLSRKLAVSA